MSQNIGRKDNHSTNMRVHIQLGHMSTVPTNMIVHKIEDKKVPSNSKETV